MSFFIFLSSEQEYVDGDNKLEAVVSREEFLKEAIKKYHFNDPSYPSMRMFEDEDDNGKYIEEPELRRPLPGAITEACTIFSITIISFFLYFLPINTY